MMIPAIIFFIIFSYIPMAGVVIAFQDYKLGSPMFSGEWVGLKWFEMLFSGEDFITAIINTVTISGLKILFCFPAPIVLALMLNEVTNRIFKRSVQTVVYFPHFLSWAILGGLVFSIFSSTSGIVELLGLEGSPLTTPEYFRPLLVITSLWKGTGWNSIIYLAAITSVNPEYYESAKLDGANRFQQAIYITLPSIKTTIIIMLIMQMGNILSAGFDQIFILSNPTVYEVADIIDTYVYRLGINQAKFSLATAAGLFRSVVSTVMIVGANWLAHKLGEEGMW